MRDSVIYSLGVAPVVDTGALEVLVGRRAGLDHSLAFAMLDGQLVRLAKAVGVLDLRLGKALGPMLAGGYEAIGYSRSGDYCVEELGFGRRMAELLRRQADQMERHPVVRAAYEEGLINGSAARLVLNHLDARGGSAEELVGLATTCTVRALKERLDGLERGGRDGSGEAPVRDAVSLEAAEEAAEEAADAAGERAPVMGTWLTYHLAPEWVATWDAVVEHFSRTEEVDLKAWQVLELLAADFQAGRPVDVPVALPDPAVAASGPSAGEARLDARWDRRRDGEPGAWRKMLEEVSHCWKWLAEVPRIKVELAGRTSMPIPADPHELHALIRDLIACRRRLDVYLGRMLRTMADYNLARLAQFASICHYAAERLGLGASTTYRLIQRERRLIRRQRVYDAIVAGRIGISQADRILALPDIAPDEAWIAWAEVRTCRRLEDAVDDILEAHRVDRDAIWRRGWHPPAEGEILTTRQVPLAPGQGGKPADPSAVVAPAQAADSVQTAVAEAVKWLPMFSQAGPGLRIFVPDEALPVIRMAEELARQMAGQPLSSEACLVALMVGAEARYTEFERKIAARRRRTLRKYRFRCAVPGCRARRGLHIHHLIFRSHGGGDEDENLIPLCPCHHLRGIHEGRLKVRLRDGTLEWLVGIRAGRVAQAYIGEVKAS